MPLTSQTASLLPGEFVLADWAAAGLNTQTAVKRGFHTAHPKLVVKALGTLAPVDARQVELSVRMWLGL